ncbi:polysaccharide deacetylase [Clostridiales bacterium oral taxon 876 str. F0540]|nr:polysaccharide deacetylase [Clostridiales bacterium oral taxon 876 str. F0540]
MVLFGTSCNNIPKNDKQQVLLSNSSDIEDQNVKKELDNDLLISEQREQYECNKVIHKYQAKQEKKLKTDKIKGIPVLMYHSIDFQPKNDLKVPKDKFEEQMKYLKENGYTTLTMEELYKALNNMDEIPEKPVVLSFDDGYRDNYTEAYPILKKYNLKGTVFIISDLVDKSTAYLSSSQIKEMSNYGINIESHTVYHEELNLLSYDRQFKTLARSKKDLEGITGKQITALAYPVGKYNDNAVKATSEAGYKMAFTTRYGFAKKDSGMYTLSRIRINGSDSIATFKAKLGL